MEIHIRITEGQMVLADHILDGDQTIHWYAASPYRTGKGLIWKGYKFENCLDRDNIPEWSKPE